MRGMKNMKFEKKYFGPSVLHTQVGEAQQRNRSEVREMG